MKDICIAFCSLLFLATNSLAFDYLPEPVAGNQQLTYLQFTLSYNEEHEQPSWVAYELTAEEVAADLDRCDCFAEDDSITTGSAEESDYRSTGFDRGHLSPAADNNASEEANRQSFLMSNMSPQLPSFNRGIWADLEEWVRDRAESFHQIYVITGPVFINNLGKIGDSGITIPGYFFKTLLYFDGDEAKTIGFLLPHVGATGELKEYAVPVNTIETLTGLELYPELSNSVENRVESRYSFSSWEHRIYR